MTTRPSSGRCDRRRLAALALLPVLLLLTAGIPPALAAPAHAAPDVAPFGGIVGVLQPGEYKPDPGAFRSLPVWRSLTAVQKDTVLNPVASADPFVGGVQLWLDRNDNRYAAGERARVFLAADQGAYVQLLTVGATGAVEWLYPAEKVDAPMVPRWIQPGRTLVLPQEADAFYYRMDPPAGASVLYAIVSSSPLPDEARAALRPQIAEAGRSGDLAAIRAAIAGFADRYPAWRMRTVALPYDIVDAPSAAAAPAPSPAPPPAPAGPSPALPWLRPGSPGAPPLTVQLNAQAYAAGASVAVKVRTEIGCSLMVLALGAGGQADLLYPNLISPEPRLPAGTELRIPPSGSELVLRVRGPSGREPERERVVAVCMPPDLPRLTDRTPTRASPTLSFPPGSPELAVLDGLRERLGALVVAEASYVVGPAASAEASQ